MGVDYQHVRFSIGRGAKAPRYEVSPASVRYTAPVARGFSPRQNRQLPKPRATEHRASPADGDDRFDDRPRGQRLRHAHVQVFLHQPEPAVVDMRRDQRSGADRDDEQLLVDVGMPAMSGAMMLAAVMTDTVAEPTDSRSSDAITQPITSGDS